MHRIVLWAGFAAAVALMAAGCEQVVLGPTAAVSAPVSDAAPTRAIADLRAHAGETYSNFAATGGARYGPDELGFNGPDSARLRRAMASPVAGQLLDGGGAEALVFRGCAQTGCNDGAAVVAIDTATGAVFVAIHDAGGADVLAPNDRIEALLRLNSPSRRWDDPAPTQTAAAQTARP